MTDPGATIVDHDVILVGGGLQNAMILLAVLDARPNARIALVEQDLALGGNHTWCFHALDLSEIHGRWIEPLVAHRWSAYDVAFPTLRTTVHHEYAAVTSERLNDYVQAKGKASANVSLILGCPVAHVREGEVGLRDGRTLRAMLVVDARGPVASGDQRARCGYQKFVGLEVELAVPQARTRPIVMDATVPQIDGYRFVYTLPFSPTRWLIEDTYFSETAAMDENALRARIFEYAERQGWKIRDVVRQEQGVLPMPWKSEPDVAPPGVLVAGYRGGWFHPATGYSLPVAARLAQHIADHAPDQVLGSEFDRMRRTHRSQQRFCHLLNYMMFCAITPSERWGLFAKFYGLPDDTIQRFYALTLTMRDQARLLSGRPPKGLSFKALVTGVR
jgi:lycopene beta-cyclase